MLALPISIQEAVNPAFPADKCKDLRGESRLGVADLFDGNSNSHHCLYISHDIGVIGFCFVQGCRGDWKREDQGSHSV